MLLRYAMIKYISITLSIALTDEIIFLLGLFLDPSQAVQMVSVATE